MGARPRARASRSEQLNLDLEKAQVADVAFKLHEKISAEVETYHFKAKIPKELWIALRDAEGNDERVEILMRPKVMKAKPDCEAIPEGAKKEQARKMVAKLLLELQRTEEDQ